MLNFAYVFWFTQSQSLIKSYFIIVIIIRLTNVIHTGKVNILSDHQVWQMNPIPPPDNSSDWTIYACIKLVERYVPNQGENTASHWTELTINTNSQRIDIWNHVISTVLYLSPLGEGDRVVYQLSRCYGSQYSPDGLLVFTEACHSMFALVLSQ